MSEVRAHRQEDGTLRVEISLPESMAPEFVRPWFTYEDGSGCWKGQSVTPPNLRESGALTYTLTMHPIPRP